MTCQFQTIDGKMVLTFEDGFVQSIDEARAEIRECVAALKEIKDAESTTKRIFDDLKPEDPDRPKVSNMLKRYKHHFDKINKGVCDVQMAVIAGGIAPSLNQFLKQ